VIRAENPVFTGCVSVLDYNNSLGYIKVNVNISTRESNCPCRFRDEMGRNCSHVHTLLLTFSGLDDDDVGSPINWIDSRYHLDIYKRCYKANIPAMVVHGKLVPDVSFALPD
jgi:hypothetical protein